MKKSRFTDSQILEAPKRAEAGLAVPERCRELGISSATFYKWRSKYGGMDAARGHSLFALAPADVDLKVLTDIDYVARGYLRKTKAFGILINPEVAATVFHMEAVATLILSGKFVGYLPTHYAQQWVRQDLMRSLRPRSPDPSRRVSTRYPKRPRGHCRGTDIPGRITQRGEPRVRAAWIEPFGCGIAA